MDPQGAVDDHEPEFDDPIIDSELSEETEASFPSESTDGELPPVEGVAPPVEGEAQHPPVAPLLPLPGVIPTPPPSQPTYQPVPPVYTAAPAQAPPQQDYRFFSASELDELVLNGQITEAQKQDRIQEQQTIQIQRTVQEQARQTSIQDQLNQYSQLAPGWNQIGSPIHQQITPALNRLLGLGMPDSAATHLLALEQTYGTLDRIRSAQAAKRQTAERRPAPQGVGRRPAPASSKSQKDPLKVLGPDDLAVYKEEIRKGQYADWNAVRAELRGAAQNKYNPKLAAKHAGVLR